MALCGDGSGVTSVWPRGAVDLWPDRQEVPPHCVAGECESSGWWMKVAALLRAASWALLLLKHVWLLWARCFYGRRSCKCAYHPNCKASLISWEHFFFLFCCFFLLWACIVCVRACVCCRLVDISILFSSKRIVAHLWAFIMGCFKGCCRGIYGFLFGCIYNSSSLTRKVWNCTNLDCLPFSGVPTHYL